MNKFFEKVRFLFRFLVEGEWYFKNINHNLGEMFKKAEGNRITLDQFAEKRNRDLDKVTEANLTVIDTTRSVAEESKERYKHLSKRIDELVNAVEKLAISTGKGLEKVSMDSSDGLDACEMRLDKLYLRLEDLKGAKIKKRKKSR